MACNIQLINSNKYMKIFFIFSHESRLKIFIFIHLTFFFATSKKCWLYIFMQSLQEFLYNIQRRMTQLGLFYTLIIALLLSKCETINCSKTIIPYYGGSSCLPCADPKCIWCPYNPDNCFECEGQFFGEYSGVCVPCFEPNCKFCGYLAIYCKECIDHYGFINGQLDQPCVPCFDSNCLKCGPPQFCIQCISGYAWAYNSCNPCSISNCFSCSPLDNCTACINGFSLQANGECVICPVIDKCTSYSTYCYCNKCQLGFVLHSSTLCLSCQNLTKPHMINKNGNCYYCTGAYCLKCQLHPTYCSQCDNSLNYALYDYYCIKCHSSCRNCSPTDFLFCISCISYSDRGHYLINGNCYYCINNCISCSDTYSCNICQNGYYLDSFDKECYSCPINCSLCFYNTTNQTQCTSCKSGLQVYKGLCRQICGDEVTKSFPCDNKLNQPYDGCNSACFVEPGFNCSVIGNFSTVCSYIDPITVQLLSFKRQRFTNQFQMKIKISPPLYIFKLASINEDLKNLFNISNSTIYIKDLTYDINTGQLTFVCGFTQNILELNIQLTLNQWMGYTVEHHSFFKIEIPFPLYYYPQQVCTISKILTYYCYFLMAFGWILFLVSICLRKLAGLEAMFVLQYSWLIMLWLDSKLIPPYEAVYPLKYTSGYNHLFFSQIDFQSNSNPYFSNFLLSKQYFADNFNFSLILPLFPLIACLITYVRLKIFINYRQNLEKQEKDSQKILSRLQILQGHYSRSLASFMHMTLFCWIYFTTCCILFFKFGKEFIHSFSLASLGLGVLYIVLALIKFYYEPISFQEFSTSFRNSILASRHYYIHCFVLCLSVILLGLFPDIPWIALIPCSLMILFTLVYQPYRYPKQNYRSAFNYLVICSWIVLKMLIQKFPVNSPIMFTIYVLNILGLLTMVIIVSVISIMYYSYYEKVIVPRQQKQLQRIALQTQKGIRIHILNDLTRTDVTKQICNLTNESIFKKTLNTKENLIQLTNRPKSSLPIEENEVKYAENDQKNKQDKKVKQKSGINLYQQQLIEQMHAQENSMMESIKKHQSMKNIPQQKQHKNNMKAVKKEIENINNQKKKDEEKPNLNINFIQNMMMEQEQQQKQTKQSPDYKRPQVKKIVKEIIIDQKIFINYQHAQMRVKQLKMKQKDQMDDQYMNAYELIDTINPKSQ